MHTLGIDIETYSSVDLASSGVYRYSESPDFAVLLFAYAIDFGEVQCVDLASGEQLPDDVRAALTDPSVVKTAFNASFERVCLSRFLGLDGFLDPAQWQCTMVASARCGLPLSLGQCAEVLHLEQGKMTEGRALIRYFSVPARNGERHLPSDAPDRWAIFKAYNIRDVEVEQAIIKKVSRIEVPEFDRRLQILDQRINDRGVRIDPVLVNNAARFDDEYKAELLSESQRITGLENPNSPAQLKEWIHNVAGFPVTTLRKSDLDDIERRAVYFPTVQHVLRNRRELGKTSNRKYFAMQQCVAADGRIHGLLQFYGASRTGRWSGRFIQPQNLPQNHLADLDYARNLVRAGDLAELEMNFEKPSQVLSELIRTALIPSEGHVFHVCDFSAIEARVIAWLAGEEWVLDVFRKGRDIYCETAGKMFGVPCEKHGVNAHLRPKGKVAVLALGYGGGVAALEAMGGSKMGLTENEEKDITRRWRDSNRHIVRLWEILEQACITAIRTGKSVPLHRGMVASFRWGMLMITLPSGRTICYPRARIETEYNDDWRGDHDSIVYEGINQTTHKWVSMRTYGGKLTENCVQAIARDILGAVLLRAEAAGLDVVFHVHDEIIVDAPPSRTLDEVEALFSEPMPWCRDLPLKGAGYSGNYYFKD